MIDYWCNAFSPDRAPLWAAVIEKGALSIRTRDGDDADGFVTAAAMVDRMDALGIATLILPVCELAADAPLEDFAHYALRPEEMQGLATDHPGRFVGMWSVDPGGAGADVDRAKAALATSWCVGLHTHTHSWNRSFDHPDYEPYYSLCAEHEVPFVMQAGGSGGDFPHDCGHPAAIAEPARTFPGVTFVLSHTGAPWVAETVAAAADHDNVVIGIATHPPRRWPSELLEFLQGPGRAKVLFATGFPLTGHTRSLAQLDDLGLDAEVRDLLLHGNARRIFARIPESIGG